MELKGKADYRLSNKEIVSELKEVLAAMEIKGANVFKIRAFQNAIASIEALTLSVYDIWQNGHIEDIAGVGSSLSHSFSELFKTGQAMEFQAVKQGLPEGMFPLIGIRGVGAKTAFKLASAFKLTSRTEAVEIVRQKAEQGEIRILEGFAQKKEQDILEAINDAKLTKNESQRMLLIQAEDIATRLINYLKKLPEVEKAYALGSLRRRSPTIGDLDFVVATTQPDKVIKAFLQYPEIGEVIREGDKKAAAILKEGNVQVELRVSTPEAYGAMLQYSTGSKQHNVVLRTYALDRGMSLSEYGIKTKAGLLEFADEENFYHKLGLKWIPPEIRQGKDEVEKASKDTLPKLVELSDIKGDLHTHTNFSDGANSLDEMIEAARAKNYEYYGITDHAPSVRSRGKYEVLGIIFERRRSIEQINSSNNNLRVLFGYEVNILADSSIALPDEYLEKLDFVIAGIHTAFNQSREEITNRLLSAIKNPHINIIAHPSGRTLNKREPYPVDWEKIFDAALEYNKILEIDAQPTRLDLPEDLVYEALKRGLKFVISSDAHSVNDLDLLKYGVDTARRGWCEKEHILNTLPLEEFLIKLLSKK